MEKIDNFNTFGYIFLTISHLHIINHGLSVCFSISTGLVSPEPNELWWQNFVFYEKKEKKFATSFRSKIVTNVKLAKNWPNSIFGPASKPFKLDLEQKNFRKNWIFLYFFFKKISKESAMNRSKNGGTNANTTSSSSKFWEDSKNNRLFLVGPTTVLENCQFLSQSGFQNCPSLAFNSAS